MNSMEEFVKNNYEERVVNAYMRLNLNICKIDFFKYLSIYKLGGIFADSDTECIHSLDSWISNQTYFLF